jgi:hypothetical protein
MTRQARFSLTPRRLHSVRSETLASQGPRLKRTAVVALTLVVSIACSSGGATPDSDVSAVDQSLLREGWKSLNSANHNVNLDVSTHLICSADPNVTADQVLCFRASGSTFENAEVVVTNWGVSKDPKSGFYRIAGGAVKSVSILRFRERILNPARPDAAVYKIYVLSADNVVRYTIGESDKFYEGDNFKKYSTFIAPVASNGAKLVFKKIMWMNEDGRNNDYVGKRRLFAITNDNKLYRTDASATAWQLHTINIKDMGHAGGLGATFLTTDGNVWYDVFSSDPNDFSGYLPRYAGANITAVGGLWALTDSGAGGSCDQSACAGDPQRILHFSWRKWKWEPWFNQLFDAGYDISLYFPLGNPVSCMQYDANGICTQPAVSPLIRDSIVDPHGFGTDHIFCGSLGVCFDWRFELGPFVGDARQRVYFYSTGLIGEFPYPFHTCSDDWDDTRDEYIQGSCGNICTQREELSYCGGAAGTPQSCFSGTCQDCGAPGQPCCVGRVCPNGINVGCASDNRCYPQ